MYEYEVTYIYDGYEPQVAMYWSTMAPDETDRWPLVGEIFETCAEQGMSVNKLVITSIESMGRSGEDVV